MLARWYLRLSEFEFDVVDRARIKHQAADSLSRMTATGANRIPIEHELSIAVIDTTLNTEDKPTLHLLCCQAEIYFVEDNANLQKIQEAQRLLKNI